MVEAVLPENQFLPILISIHMPARLSYPNWGPLWRCLTATHPVKVLCLQNTQAIRHSGFIVTKSSVCMVLVWSSRFGGKSLEIVFPLSSSSQCWLIPTKNMLVVEKNVGCRSVCPPGRSAVADWKASASASKTSKPGSIRLNTTLR